LQKDLARTFPIAAANLEEGTRASTIRVTNVSHVVWEEDEKEEEGAI
jgi:hypothetical protein